MIVTINSVDGVCCFTFIHPVSQKKLADDANFKPKTDLPQKNHHFHRLVIGKSHHQGISC